LIRVEKPSAIPLESLHGRKEDIGKTIRLTLGATEPREFSLNPQQGDVRAAYVPLVSIAAGTGREWARSNTLLLAGPLPKASLSFGDFGGPRH
jgi:hypothetical protein